MKLFILLTFTMLYFTTAMRLDLTGESGEQRESGIMEGYDTLRDSPINFLEAGEGKDAAWTHELDSTLTRGKRYNEFLGKRGEWLFPPNSNDDVMKRWNEFVGKRVPEEPFVKRYMEFLGKRQHNAPNFLKRYVEFLG